MFNHMRAQLKKDTVLKKVTALKREWLDGRASEADERYWEKVIEDLETEIVPVLNRGKKELEEAVDIIAYLKHSNMIKRLSKESHASLIFSGLNGDLSNLDRGKDIAKEGDILFVLGNFLPEDQTRPLQESVQTIMRLVREEGIVFILGKLEREALLEKEWTAIEQAFLETLPTYVDTADFSLFADEKGDGLVDLIQIMDGVYPNLSDKLFVFRNPHYCVDDFHVNHDTRVMALQPGVITRLDVSETPQDAES